MRGSENVGLSDERYRDAAGFLVSIPIYLGAFSASWVAFGFGKAAALLALFLVVGGHRAVSALTSRWVRNLPKPEAAPYVRRGRAKGSGKPQKMLVIEHDPDEFARPRHDDLSA
jgi:hypothetical protein